MIGDDVRCDRNLSQADRLAKGKPRISSHELLESITKDKMPSSF